MFERINEWLEIAVSLCVVTIMYISALMVMLVRSPKMIGDDIDPALRILCISVATFIYLTLIAGGLFSIRASTCFMLIGVIAICTGVFLERARDELL